MRRGLLLVLVLLLAGAGVRLLLGGASAGADGFVSGTILDADGPVAGASVRVRATENSGSSDADGRFTLSSLTIGQPVEVAAWADGYYITSTHVTPTISGVTLTLRRYHTSDHPGYSWTSPISGTSAGACGNCHPMVISQWISNAHGSAISNERFFSLYNGSNLSGTEKAGPGYLLDFPGTAGSCANCHAPGEGIDGYLTTDMNSVRDNITSGIHCDYCHKTGGVYLNPATQSVYANVPGAQSQRMLRPPPGDDIFFGPYDDIKDPDTFLPLISESAYCAPCHQFSFWGTPIYSSYEEWLDSPYAAQGVTCQDCHMPPNGDTHFVLPEKGGLAHPPESIPSHQQLGAASQTLLQNTVTMTAKISQALGQITVTVTISNSGAGHHVPTDFPGRQMILVVTAVNGLGAPLLQLDGPTVPSWGGPEAGLPGMGFAKILRDVISGEEPVVSYWRQALISSDNRIPALAAHRSSYSFAAPPGAMNVTISARLMLRRVFYQVADEKGWAAPDMVMEKESWQVLPAVK